MAGATKAKSDKGKTPQKSEPERGTSDELEILRLIVSEVPGLRQKVLDKIRDAKDRALVKAAKGAVPKDAG